MLYFYYGGLWLGKIIDQSANEKKRRYQVLFVIDSFGALGVHRNSSTLVSSVMEECRMHWSLMLSFSIRKKGKKAVKGIVIYCSV